MIRIIFTLVLLVILVGCDRPNRGSVKYGETSAYKLDNKDVGRSNRGKAGNDNNVKMTPMGGVYEIPIKINGINMDIIFDTGASNISISETEVLFLWKQGKLDENDILGSMQFKDATGKISEGTIINLRNVQIGNRVINDVEASVVHNSQAPLLLGQSALARFGKVTIDYNENILSFE